MRPRLGRKTLRRYDRQLLRFHYTVDLLEVKRYVCTER